MTKCDCYGVRGLSSEETKIVSNGVQDFSVCLNCYDKIEELKKDRIDSEDFIAENVDYINPGLIAHIRGMKKAASTSTKCPHCAHVMNEYGLKNHWCANCNSKVESEDMSSYNTSGGGHLDLSGLNDNELCEKMGHNGSFFRTLFYALGSLQIVAAVFGLIGISKLTYEFSERLSILYIIPILLVLLSFIWFAIGNYLYLKMLGLARLIEQGNRK